MASAGRTEAEDGSAGLSAVSERRATWAAAVLLALAGLAVRLWHVAGTPLWLDEAYSAYAAGHDLAFLWRVVPLYETHPPFYYTLLHAWEAPFGDGLVALRSFGLLAAVLTPPAIAWTAAAIADSLGWGEPRRRRLVLAAFALACVSIPLVEMAREVRPYPLMILLYALATRALLAIEARHRAGQPLAGRAYAAYLLILELMLWLHNLGPLWAVAMGLALLVALAARRPTGAELGWLIGGHLLVALAYLPGLLILADQAPTWIASTWVRFALGTATAARLAVLYAVPDWPGLAALALAGLGLAALARAGRRIAAMLLVLAIVPTSLSIVVSLTVAPVFITRTLSPVAVPALLLFAVGAAGWTGRRGWAGLAAAAVLGTNALAVDVQARAEGPPQDWYGTVGWLAKRWRPGDLILAYPNEGALPLARAIRDKGYRWPVRPVPAAVPALGWGDWHPTGNRGVVSLPRPALHRIAGQPEFRAAPTIWLLRLGAETYDPGDMFLDELRPGRRIVRRWLAGPIDVVGLRRTP